MKRGLGAEVRMTAKPPQESHAVSKNEQKKRWVVHYPPDLNSPVEQSGEIANSAYKKFKKSFGTTVDSATTMRINTH